MKKSFLGVICAIALFTASSVIAGPPFFNEVVSVTDTNSVVTPVLSGGRATSVRVLNDGSAAIFVDFDRVAVADADTAVKIGPCEGREFLFDSTGIGYLGIIAGTSETSTARVEIHNLKGLFPQGYPSVVDRSRYIENKGCAANPDILASDAELAAIAGLTSAADKGIQFTGSGTAAVYALTTAAKTVLDDATVAAMVDTLGGASATGTGGIVRATTPTLVTPVLGAATGTSVVLTGSATAVGGVIIDAADSHIFAKKVTLTEAGGAELVATFTSAAGATFGVELSYKVVVTDGTDFSARNGKFSFVCVNKATAVTCTKDATDETEDDSQIIATNSNTLTYAIAHDVGTANVAKITFNIDSDITSNGADIVYTAIVSGAAVVS